jgi:hypothetical protein
MSLWIISCYQKPLWKFAEALHGRCYVFKTKIPIWVNFGALEWKCWYTYFMVVWNILCPFDNVVVIWYIFIPVLVYCVKKNLATLLLCMHKDLETVHETDTMPLRHVAKAGWVCHFPICTTYMSVRTILQNGSKKRKFRDKNEKTWGRFLSPFQVKNLQVLDLIGSTVLPQKSS